MITFTKVYNVNVEFKEKWVAALRSGEYKQTKGMLYNADQDGYCCVGVAHKLCGVPERIMNRSGLLQLIFGVKASMVNSLPMPVLRKLSSMNDKGHTFKEIADYIERNF